MQSIGVEYLSNFPTPFWYYYGKIVAKGIYGNEKQLRLLNCIRVRTREFISFTNATFADRKAVGKVMPLNVVEVDILKPRPGEPLQLFWKPARGIITQRVKHCESLPFNCASREPHSCNAGVENLEHLDCLPLITSQRRRHQRTRGRKIQTTKCQLHSRKQSLERGSIAARGITIRFLSGQPHPEWPAA